MKISIKILFLLFCFTNSLALEVFCKFEEVYSNGDVQQGYFLIKDKNIRYEYFDNDLFTIFKNEEGYFIVENSNPKNFRKLNKTKIIDELLDISSNFPDVRNQYLRNGYEILLENSSENNFYKRIIIKSQNLNLSIYLNECDFIKIQKWFFMHERVVNFPVE